MNSDDRLFSNNFMNVMIHTKRLATIFVLTAILITGSLNAVQYAYSSGPDTLTVKYLGPDPVPLTYTIEIYKKIDDFESLPLGPPIPIENIGDEFMVISQNYGKDKLNSNTVFRLLDENGAQIDVTEIHTSCSKPLYIGQVVFGDAGLSLEVIDGTLGGDSILPNNEEGDCTDNKKPKHTATITLKKAITNDNGGTIKEATDIELAFDPKIDDEEVDFGVPVNISTKESHTISETIVTGYSFVLIAGDTDCPSMLDEEFTVKKNKDITCTIYNDDNGDGSTGGTGVSFGHKGFQFNTNNINAPLSRACDAGTITDSCVEIIEPVSGSKVFLIVDSEIMNPQNTLVIWSMTAVETNQFLINNCVLVGIFDSMELPGTKGFGLACPIVTGTDWNINYAFINTVFAPVV